MKILLLNHVNSCLTVVFLTVLPSTIFRDLECSCWNVLRVEIHWNWISRSKNHWNYFRRTFTGNMAYHKFMVFSGKKSPAKQLQRSFRIRPPKPWNSRHIVISRDLFPLAVGCIPSQSLLLNIPLSFNFRSQFLNGCSFRIHVTWLQIAMFHHFNRFNIPQMDTNGICFSSHSSTPKKNTACQGKGRHQHLRLKNGPRFPINPQWNHLKSTVTWRSLFSSFKIWIIFTVLRVVNSMLSTSGLSYTVCQWQ